MTTIEFTPYPKTPRLFRECVITEKIDGTNAAVGITHDGIVYAQSRNRLIFPGKTTDNAGFAQWVADNAETLRSDLGPGLHFGEWWGSGIQRGYGKTDGERFFSLFNVARWEEADTWGRFDTPNLHAVPVLYRGQFSTALVEDSLIALELRGSLASPGFMRPEGVVVYHTASRQVFKALIENDDAPKGGGRLMHEHTVIDLSSPDPIGGERCRHDMVAAWCANCLKLPDVPLLDRLDEREVY